MKIEKSEFGNRLKSSSMGDAGQSRPNQPKWSQMDKKQYFGKLLTMMVGMRTVLFPLQVVKTRLQVMKKWSFWIVLNRFFQFQNKADAQYSGTYDCIKKIARREGFQGKNLILFIRKEPLFIMKTSVKSVSGFFKGYPISMLSLPAGFIYLTSLELSWQFLPSSLPASVKDSLSVKASFATSSNS